jgi:hypothetical protein
MKKKKTDDFLNFIRLSKGEHKLEDVVRLANYEVYDASTRWNTAEDGLKKREVEENHG